MRSGIILLWIYKDVKTTVEINLRSCSNNFDTDLSIVIHEGKNTMESITEFKKRVAAALSDIDDSILDYHEDEFWMIRASYGFLEYYAEKNRLFNTAVALPLARGLHNGVYRKLPIIRSGIEHKPPYVIHCLTVCKMLADMWLPISMEEKDILLAAALCHDMIEDVQFENHGTELYEKFHLDPRVYQTVKLVSKRKDFTLEEEKAFFQAIMENRLSLLIKLSDRGHNVSDLYNMSDKKIQEYIGETRAYFLPMCNYAKKHYPELNDVTDIMEDQLICLTRMVEKMAEKHSEVQRELNDELQQLRAENRYLRDQLTKVREEA